MIARHVEARTRFVPMPFVLWQALAWISEHLRGTPLTRHQIALMRHDNVVSPLLPGLPQLGITATTMAAVLPKIERPGAGA
jgi:NADH dehydrogenase